MAEFEENLNRLLSDPGTMSQIMQMAQSLSEEPSSSHQAPTPSQPEQTSASHAPLSSLLSDLGGSEPSALSKFLPLIQEIAAPQSSNASQLIHALKPYLKKERQENVERALQLARLFRVGKKFLSNREGFPHV